jgi:hypothetical protein
MLRIDPILARPLLAVVVDPWLAVEPIGWPAAAPPTGWVLAPEKFAVELVDALSSPSAVVFIPIGLLVV